MRRFSLFISLFVVTCLAFVTFSCGASHQSRQTSPARSTEDGGVEDSGKRLAGQFVLISVEDQYRHDVDHPQQVDLSFDREGTFKRQDKSRIEEGSYLITPKQDLLLYVERVNGEQRTAAKVERYQIADEREEGFTLQEGSYRRSIFRKR